MAHSHGGDYDKEFQNHGILSSPGSSPHHLKADCEKCFGLCCVSLYFSASEGFPTDKDAGQPCLNLQSDFRCSIYQNLRKQGLKGCMAFDCFGAGQKVSQCTYLGNDWIQFPESLQQIIQVFQVMRQLHEMLWYLTESITLEPARPIQDKLKAMLSETECLTCLSPDSLTKLDIATHRAGVNALLLRTSELVRTNVYCDGNASSKYRKTMARGLDFTGADLRRTNLRCSNLRGAYLMAADLRGVDLTGADLIGADLRDADLGGTNLTGSIFLTQAQINTAKGDSDTKLPISLARPPHWSN